MEDVFRRNRRILTSLIFSKAQFSEAELLDDFWRECGVNAPIDGRQRVWEYLAELNELGRLNYDAGMYRVVDS